MKIIESNDIYLKMDKKTNQQTLAIAKSGKGKTYALRSIQNGYWNMKPRPVIISLACPKQECESCFVQFPAEDPTQLKSLQKIGRKPEGHPIKHYEAFTFNVPVNRLLPPINFFTFSLKELRRASWSYLIESEADSESVGLLIKASREIKKDVGLIGFLHSIQKSISGKLEGKKKIPDETNFLLSTTMGTTKSLAEISRHLTPFKYDYLLASDSASTNINWREVLNDSENINCFNTTWITDDKIRKFVTLTLLDLILKNRHLSKKRIVLVIPELRILTPSQSEGADRFLSKAVKECLSICRSKGKGGISTLACSQFLMDLDRNVRNSVTELVLGELSMDDQERLSKIYNYPREVRDNLKKMPVDFGFYLHGQESYDPFIFLPSPGMLKEESYNYFDMCSKLIPEKMKKYSEFYNEMKQKQEDEIKEFRKKIRKKEQEEEEKIRKEKEQKEERDRQKAEKRLLMNKNAEKRASENIKESVINYLNKIVEKKEKIPSNNKLAEIFPKSSVTLGKWKNKWFDELKNV